MLKLLKRLSVATLLLATVGGVAFSANPKREFRSTWLTTVDRIDWPTTKGTSASAQSAQKSEMIYYLDRLEAMKMTSTCFQVRQMGDACYPSEYAPWASYISGTRGTSPGWDPLAYFVEECHKRGIEAYVWLNPYRWTSSTTWSTAKDQEWINNDMLITGDNGKYKTFNPALPETRQLIVNVIKEILNNYEIDGIIFDDYFYPSGGTTEGTDAPDYDDYTASGTTLSIGDWRRANVNQMVADVYNAIKETRPDVRFGISPAGVAHKSASKYGLNTDLVKGMSDWQYAQIYSDPLAWLAEGTVDFVSPQCYWLTTHQTNPFGPLSQWWSEITAKNFNRHFYASHSVSYLSGADTQANWDEMGNQILYSRQYTCNNAPGSIYFSTKNVNGPGASGLGEYLKKDLYSTLSLTPEITWKSGANYSKVSNLAYNDGTLTWDATSNGNAIIRYTVYAVPMSVTIDDAKSADGDGFDVQYLQKVVYGTSYTLDADKQSNYWYIVNVFDGYGKEHESAIVNYPDGESDVATLVSPIDNEVVAWSQTFLWSSISDATYTVEIASDDEFTDLKYQVKNLTSNSTEIALDELESSTVYYWRVRTSQKGKIESVSKTESFTTGTRPAAPQTTLLSPDDNTDIEENFTMSWSPVDCEQYVLEVSSSADFESIKYTKTLTETTHELVISLLGKGTYYWRVITTGKTLTSTASDIRSFNITKIDVGNFEPGYSIKIDKDNSSYQEINNLSVNSIWFRSVDEDYDNITLESYGSYNRSFCVGKDYIYMAGRSENSSGANIYLRKFSQLTGEIVADLQLSEDGKVGYYPCNNVMCDDNGNICIANMTINASQYALKVWLVDTETGALTQIASVVPSINTSARLDHVSLTGDAKSGNFKLYAAIRNTKNIVRWTYENGTQKLEETCTLQALYPTSATNLGTAPIVLPIDDNSMFVIGGTTHLTRYDFTANATITDSFENNTELEPIGKETNGGTFFELNGNKYIVYPFSDSSNANGFTYNVVKTDIKMSFASMELLWNLPKNGLGAVGSSTFQACADYLPVNEGSGILYLFVPGNGICAYEIVDTSVGGIDEIKSDEDLIVSNNTIGFGQKAQSLTIYNISGVAVVNESDVTSVNLNIPAGIYIVRAVINEKIISKKIIVK